MALDARIHFKTFVRIDQNPNVRSVDWARIFESYELGLNFDGELWGLGHSIDDLVQVLPWTRRSFVGMLLELKRQRYAS